MDEEEIMEIRMEKKIDIHRDTDFLTNTMS